MTRKVLYCCPLLFTSAISLFGQASASLNGRVTDPQGAPLAGAAVTVNQRRRRHCPRYGDQR